MDGRDRDRKWFEAVVVARGPARPCFEALAAGLRPAERAAKEPRLVARARVNS